MLGNIYSSHHLEYGNELADDLKGDTSGDYQDLALQLVKGERDQSCDVDEDEAEKDANKLYNVSTK